MGDRSETIPNMSSDEHLTTSEDFVRIFLVTEIEKMKAAGIKLHLLSAMVHGIEVFGALSDKLPYKAKGHGKKRFSLALRQLFPARYAQANRQIDLYGCLRSHLTHSLIPAKQILVLASGTDRHLEIESGRLCICLDILYQDYLDAARTLCERLQSGKMKNNRMALNYLEGLL